MEPIDEQLAQDLSACFKAWYQDFTDTTDSPEDMMCDMASEIVNMIARNLALRYSGEFDECEFCNIASL